MHIQAQLFGHVGVLTVTIPRLTSGVARTIRDEARKHLGSGLPVYLVDLARVTQIDSAGLGALVGVMKQAGRDRRLELCGINPRVRRALQLTRLDTVFRLHRDVESALAAHGWHDEQTG